MKTPSKGSKSGARLRVPALVAEFKVHIMDFLEQLRLLRRLHDLIQRKATGSTNELADKLKISRASLYRKIEILKEFGAPIKYDHHRSCYYYEDAFELQLT